MSSAGIDFQGVASNLEQQIPLRFSAPQNGLPLRREAGNRQKTEKREEVSLHGRCKTLMVKVLHSLPFLLSVP